MEHTHTWTSTDGRGVCKFCGEHRPKLVLRLRCEWCKQLFTWTPRSVEMIDRMRVRRACGTRCQAALSSYEFNRSRNPENRNEVKP